MTDKWVVGLEAFEMSLNISVIQFAQWADMARFKLLTRMLSTNS